jgi:RNA polymerase sigma-70 factor (ECF subfamily)
MSETDAAPASRRLTGDAAEFELLVRTHQRMVFSLAYRMTGSMADAEDLAQETFLRAYEQMSSYRGESKISTWLCRIAINACLNWRSREARRAGIHTAWSESTFALQSAPRREEMDERVQAALLRLPPKQRAAVVLTICDGLDHSEAARALGCSVPTVAWRVFTAKAKLKRWLAPSEAKL